MLLSGVTCTGNSNCAMDRASISSIQSGSETAFRRVYDEFHQKLYSYFLHKTKSGDTSGELVQLTFIKLWRFRGNLDPVVELSPQIFRIARTSLIDLLRKNAAARYVSLELVALPEIPEEPEVLLQENDPLDAIRETIAQLPPERRKIITWRLEGLSNTEIAHQLSISKKTVENQLNRALRDIRKLNAEASLVALVLALY